LYKSSPIFREYTVAPITGVKKDDDIKVYHNGADVK
jgi:hypothetical protein